MSNSFGPGHAASYGYIANKIADMKKCHCDPVCDFCTHRDNLATDVGSSYCPIKDDMVDWSDTACKEFMCPDCGRTYQSFVVKK